MAKEKLILIGSILIFLLIFIVSYFFLGGTELAKEPKPTEEEKTLEEIIKDLTAPEREITSNEGELSNELNKDLTAPWGNNTPKASEDILKKLTAP
ncbi:MAG: hypothetical protein Q7T34_02045 [Candidatus Parcubacteria bacterium]|nr:hypothetical protein [Candidatus Parcubacteria bacterium]